MKLSVSGWPGGGSSTLALILCKLLNLTHVQGGGTFRYIYKNLSYATSGQDRVDAHNLVEPLFGPMYDKFIDSLINSNKQDDLLIESDLAAFRVGLTANFFSIFLLTDKEVRRKRTGTDDRNDDGESLENIDKSHADVYEQLHGIRWFDEEMIRDKHSCVLDNSALTIADELKKIAAEMLLQKFITLDKANEIIEVAEDEESLYWHKGKLFYEEYLNRNNLIMSPVQILSSIRELFPEEVGRFPDELKAVVQNAK